MFFLKNTVVVRSGHDAFTIGLLYDPLILTLNEQKQIGCDSLVAGGLFVQPLSLSLFPSCSLLLSFSLSLYLFLSISFSLFLGLSLFVSLSVYFSLFHFICLSFFLSFFLFLFILPLLSAL